MAGSPLGRHAAAIFSARRWETIGAAYQVPVPLTHSIIVNRSLAPEEQARQFVVSLKDYLDAVINLTGGFVLGTAKDPEVVHKSCAMVESSIYPFARRSDQ
ncbi:unnamed protein product [Polarella glacialis]|uniref:Uncharacterized protein n=1 Tax=Polarella glacialis TaxID=89957 RepID=A0A813GYK0_POLGL|nr:unnamed protein product [Polarella glacialis]